MNATLADLVGSLKSTGRVSAADVLALRREFYGAPQIATEDVEALVALDSAAPDRTPDWGDFFAGAVVDYVVHQQEPAGLCRRRQVHLGDGRLRRRPHGRRLDGGAGADCRGGGRRPVRSGRVHPRQGQSRDRVRRPCRRRRGCAAQAPGVRRWRTGQRRCHAHRDEADALFDINDACKAGSNDATWPDFFAKAVADSLTAVSPFAVESREDAARGEAWLAKREGPGEFLAGMARMPDVRGAMHDILHPFSDEADEWRKAEANMETAESEAATITEEEAKWLVERLGAGGLGEPEQRLIDLLKSLAPPALERLSSVMNRAA